MSIKDLYQSGDWKAEKHVPVIDAPDTIKKGEAVQINVSVGKEIAGQQEKCLFEIIIECPGAMAPPIFAL